jgi:glycosyltransferase involved in cell wall biosynthesis
MQTAVIVAHKYLTQPDDDLVLHLNHLKAERVLHICHSFSDAKDRRSSYRLYRGGELSMQRQTKDYASWPEPLLYLKEMFFTVKWTMQWGRAWDVFVGMDGLCVLFGNVLRGLGRVRKTVFWAIDFVPHNRFGSALKNRIYGGINSSSYRRADEVWDLSPRMAEARERFGIFTPKDRRSAVVPYGVWLDRIPHYSYAQCEQRTLVFMGHLLEKQGVQLVIGALPRILASVPDVKLKIIGDGEYRRALEELAAKTGVAASCVFLGRIGNIEDLEKEIATSAVAIAPYVRALDTWTMYADPGKVKTYLACGVPVLLTDVPWNAVEIVDQGCGLVISEDPADIAAKVLRLLDGETNEGMRSKARRYAKGYEWSNIFDAALRVPQDRRGEGR